MARPLWKGFITFGLVNVPVVLYSAEKNMDIHFHLLDERNKARIKYEKINANTGKQVPWESITKGYEYGDEKYLLVSDEDLKEVAGEQSQSIDIEAFVNKKEIDYIYFDKPYYLLPDKKGDKGYVMLREILRDTDKIGIAKVVIRTRQYIAALLPFDNALLLNLMRYDDEVKKPSELELPDNNLKKYKISPREMSVAKQLVQTMTTKWKPEEFPNEYRVALQNWLDERIRKDDKETHPKKKKSTARNTNVVDFVDLLKKSLNAKPKKSKKETAKKVARR